MAFDVDELLYPTAAEVHAAHDIILKHTGGLPGVRLPIDGVVGRVESAIYYRDFANIAEVAAFYADVLVNGHYFQDGNKRTGLAVMLMFLDMNGYSVEADSIALADRMVELATHAIDERTLGQWLTPKLRLL